MRLWTLHPCYLDRQGLTALWREGLLAQAVFKGETRGYTRHPQLDRFRQYQHPATAVAAYLGAVQDEATRRGYTFDRSKIKPVRKVPAIPVTRGQIEYEWAHLMAKLAARSPDIHALHRDSAVIDTHPQFIVVDGAIEPWERP